MYWQREDLKTDYIVRETEQAILVRIPHSGYKGYCFWLPKKLVRKIKNVSDRVRVIYPLYCEVSLSKDGYGYPVYIGFALDCINNPEKHEVDEFKLEREYREYAGY